MTGTDGSWCTKDWMVMDASSGRVLHQKQGWSHASSSDGSWKGCPWTSQKQSGQPERKKISDICAKQRTWKIFFHFLWSRKSGYPLPAVVPVSVCWRYRQAMSCQEQKVDISWKKPVSDRMNRCFNTGCPHFLFPSKWRSLKTACLQTSVSFFIIKTGKETENGLCRKIQMKSSSSYTKS